MVWEFPAVSQSRVEFWKKPQFTQNGMWWFTLFFGAFGLHHFYLRSPQTGLIFMLMNMFTLGYPWFYDLIQLSKSGGNDLESLNKYGLSHPWGALGLAQGMWMLPKSKDSDEQSPKASAPKPSAPNAPAPNVPPKPSAPNAPNTLPKPAPNASAPNATDKPNPTPNTNDPTPPNTKKTMVGGGKDEKDEAPDPIWFLLYSIFLPAAPLSHYIAGDTNSAVSRFLDLTIIPLGFLFYYCAMLYDYFILFAYPADLFVAGTKRFFPFTYLGMDADGHSERLTGNSEIKPCPPDNFVLTLLRIFFPTFFSKVEAVKATATAVKENVIDEGAKLVKAGVAVAALTSGPGTLGPLPMPGAMPLPMPGAMPLPMPGAIPLPVPQMPMPMPQMPGAMPQLGKDFQTFKPDATGKMVGYGTMVGGFQPLKPFWSTLTPLDYTALTAFGAVITGGILLSANRSANDSPPDPRGI
jgi:TM2 domain-containing membrane protein YozV